VTVPEAAVGVAENETVTVHVGLHGLFVNVGVTPLGKPVAEKVTGVVVPLTRVALMEEDVLVLPWTTVRELGEGVARLKSNAGAMTVSDSEVE
jgi:hypothetical protein